LRRLAVAAEELLCRRERQPTLAHLVDCMEVAQALSPASG
jgi:hypothetical protein